MNTASVSCFRASLYNTRCSCQTQPRTAVVPALGDLGEQSHALHLDDVLAGGLDGLVLLELSTQEVVRCVLVVNDTLDEADILGRRRGVRGA